MNAQPLDWSELQLLVAVQRAGSMLRAARRLGLAASTVSRRLAALEQTAGTLLLERGPEGVRLTPAGSALAACGAEVELGVSRALRDLPRPGAALAGTIRVSAGDGFAAPKSAMMRFDLPTARRCWVFIVLSVAASCVTRDFRPLLPHRVSDGAVTVEIDGISAPPVLPHHDVDGLSIEATAILPVGTTIAGARLNEVTNPPCNGGVPNRPVPNRPVQHVVPPVATESSGTPLRKQFAFSRAMIGRAHLFVNEPVALDLAIVDDGRPELARCVRIALQTASSRAEWQATPSFASLELRPFVLGRGLPSYRNGGGFFAVGGGTWLDEWRLGLALEIGVIGSRATASQTWPHAVFAGGALQANRILLDRGRSAVDIGLAYDMLGVGDTPAAKSPATALHGPRATLRWIFLAGRSDWRGFRFPPDASALALGAFAGAWWEGFEQLAPSPIFGISLEGNLGSALLLIP